MAIQITALAIWMEATWPSVEASGEASEGLELVEAAFDLISLLRYDGANAIKALYAISESRWQGNLDSN